MSMANDDAASPSCEAPAQLQPWPRGFSHPIRHRLHDNLVRRVHNWALWGAGSSGRGAAGGADEKEEEGKDEDVATVGPEDKHDGAGGGGEKVDGGKVEGGMSTAELKGEGARGMGSRAPAIDAVGPSSRNNEGVVTSHVFLPLPPSVISVLPPSVLPPRLQCVPLGPPPGVVALCRLRRQRRLWW